MHTETSTLSPFRAPTHLPCLAPHSVPPRLARLASNPPRSAPFSLTAKSHSCRAPNSPSPKPCRPMPQVCTASKSPSLPTLLAAFCKSAFGLDYISIGKGFYCVWACPGLVWYVPLFLFRRLTSRPPALHSTISPSAGTLAFFPSNFAAPPSPSSTHPPGPAVVHSATIQ